MTGVIEQFNDEELQKFAKEFANAVIECDKNYRKRRRKIPMPSYPRENLIRLGKSTLRSVRLSSPEIRQTADRVEAILEAHARELLQEIENAK